MGRLTCFLIVGEQKGPGCSLHKFPYLAYGQQSLDCAMLTADSMKIGHLEFLENANENHKQNLILTPGRVDHHSPLNRLPASQLELVLEVLQLLKRYRFSLGLLIALPLGTWKWGLTAHT